MLQNAVHDIDELRQVKNTADHLGTSNGYKVKYDEYTSLFFSTAAAAYNAKFNPQLFMQLKITPKQLTI